MRWKFSASGGISGWFAPRAARQPAADGRLAAVREAMLAARGLTSGPDGQRLAERIRRASDLQALWHLRVALMDTLCHQHGEPLARAQLARITALFGDQGVALRPLPGLRSRPGDLGTDA